MVNIAIDGILDFDASQSVRRVKTDMEKALGSIDVKNTVSFDVLTKGNGEFNRRLDAMSRGVAGVGKVLASANTINQSLSRTIIEKTKEVASASKTMATRLRDLGQQSAEGKKYNSGISSSLSELKKETAVSNKQLSKISGLNYDANRQLADVTKQLEAQLKVARETQKNTGKSANFSITRSILTGTFEGIGRSFSGGVAGLTKKIAGDTKEILAPIGKEIIARSVIPDAIKKTETASVKTFFQIAEQIATKADTAQQIAKQRSQSAELGTKISKETDFTKLTQLNVKKTEVDKNIAVLEAKLAGTQPLTKVLRENLVSTIKEVTQDLFKDGKLISSIRSGSRSVAKDIKDVVIERTTNFDSSFATKLAGDSIVAPIFKKIVDDSQIYKAIDTLIKQRKESRLDEATNKTLQLTEDILKRSAREPRYTPQELAAATPSIRKTRMKNIPAANLATGEADTLIVALGGYPTSAGKSGLAADIFDKAMQSQLTNIAVKDMSTSNQSLSGIVSALKQGYTDDAVKIAAEVTAALIANPKLSAKIYGESGSGFSTAEDALRILGALGFEGRVTGMGAGTPTLAGDLTPASGSKILGYTPNEPVGQAMLRLSEYGLTKVTQEQISASPVVKDRSRESYLNSAEVQKYLFNLTPPKDSDVQGQRELDSLIQQQESHRQSVIKSILNNTSGVETLVANRVTRIREDIARTLEQGQGDEITQKIRRELGKFLEEDVSNISIDSVTRKVKILSEVLSKATASGITTDNINEIESTLNTITKSIKTIPADIQGNVKHLADTLETASKNTRQEISRVRLENQIPEIIKELDQKAETAVKEKDIQSLQSLSSEQASLTEKIKAVFGEEKRGKPILKEVSIAVNAIDKKVRVLEDEKNKLLKNLSTFSEKLDKSIKSISENTIPEVTRQIVEINKQINEKAKQWTKDANVTAKQKEMEGLLGEAEKIKATQEFIVSSKQNAVGSIGSSDLSGINEIKGNIRQRITALGSQLDDEKYKDKVQEQISELESLSIWIIQSQQALVRNTNITPIGAITNPSKTFQMVLAKGKLALQDTIRNAANEANIDNNTIDINNQISEQEEDIGRLLSGLYQAQLRKGARQVKRAISNAALSAGQGAANAGMAAAKGAVKVGGLGWDVLQSTENFALDVLPFGKTAKKAVQTIGFPVAGFLAASQAPVVGDIIQSLPSTASSLAEPMINQLVPMFVEKIPGILRGAATELATQGLDKVAAGVAVLIVGRITQAIVRSMIQRAKQAAFAALPDELQDTVLETFSPISKGDRFQIEKLITKITKAQSQTPSVTSVSDLSVAKQTKRISPAIVADPRKAKKITQASTAPLGEARKVAAEVVRVGEMNYTPQEITEKVQRMKAEYMSYSSKFNTFMKANNIGIAARQALSFAKNLPTLEESLAELARFASQKSSKSSDSYGRSANTVEAVRKDISNVFNKVVKQFYKNIANLDTDIRQELITEFINTGNPAVAALSLNKSLKDVQKIDSPKLLELINKKLGSATPTSGQENAVNELNNLQERIERLARNFDSKSTQQSRAQSGIEFLQGKTDISNQIAKIRENAIARQDSEPHFKQVIQTADKLLEQLQARSKQIATVMRELGVNVISGFIRGMKPEEVKSMAKDLGDDFVESLKKALEIKSPSKKMQRIAGWLLMGLKDLVLGVTPIGKQTGESLISALKDSLEIRSPSAKIQGISKWMLAGFNKLVDGAKAVGEKTGTFLVGNTENALKQKINRVNEQLAALQVKQQADPGNIEIQNEVEAASKSIAFLERQLEKLKKGAIGIIPDISDVISAAKSKAVEPLQSGQKAIDDFQQKAIRATANIGAQVIVGVAKTGVTESVIKDFVKTTIDSGASLGKGIRDGILAAAEQDLERTKTEIKRLESAIEENTNKRNAQLKILTPSFPRKVTDKDIDDAEKRLPELVKAYKNLLAKESAASESIKFLEKQIDFVNAIPASLQTVGKNIKNFLNDPLTHTRRLLKDVGTVAKSALLGFIAMQFFDMQSFISALQEAGRTFIEFESVTQGIKNTSNSSEASVQSLKKLREETDRLKVSYMTAANGVMALQASAQGTDAMRIVPELTTGLLQATRVYNLSSEQLDRANTAIAQSLSKGVVSQEELKGQLAEALPGALQIAARAYGVTTQELDKMVTAGELSTVFFEKFARQLKAETTIGAAQSVDTLAAKIADLQNQWQVLQINFLSAVLPILEPVGDILTSIIKVLSQNTWVVKVLIQGLVILATTALAPVVNLAAQFALKILEWKQVPFIIKLLLSPITAVSQAIKGVTFAITEAPALFGKFATGLKAMTLPAITFVGMGQRIKQAFQGIPSVISSIAKSSVQGFKTISAGIFNVVKGVEIAVKSVATFGATLAASFLVFTAIEQVISLFTAWSDAGKSAADSLSAINDASRRMNETVGKMPATVKENIQEFKDAMPFTVKALDSFTRIFTFWNKESENITPISDIFQVKALESQAKLIEKIQTQINIAKNQLASPNVKASDIQQTIDILIMGQDALLTEKALGEQVNKNKQEQLKSIKELIPSLQKAADLANGISTTFGKINSSRTERLNNINKTEASGLMDIAVAEAKGLSTKEQVETAKLKLTEKRVSGELAVQKDALHQITGLMAAQPNEKLKEQQTQTEQEITRLTKEQADARLAVRRNELDNSLRALDKYIKSVESSTDAALKKEALVNQQQFNDKIISMEELSRREQTAEMTSLDLKISNIWKQIQLTKAANVAEEESVSRVADLKVKLADAELEKARKVGDAIKRRLEEEKSLRGEAFEQEKTRLQQILDLEEARNSVARARESLKTTRDELLVARLERAKEIVRQLNDDENITAQERINLRQELTSLGINGSTSILGLTQQIADIEYSIIKQKASAQEAENQRALKRLETEAKIAEITNRQAVIAAQEKVISAKQELAAASPEDKALAEEKLRLAQEGLILAQQSQLEINRLKREELQIQQQITAEQQRQNDLFKKLDLQRGITQSQTPEGRRLQTALPLPTSNPNNVNWDWVDKMVGQLEQINANIKPSGGTNFYVTAPPGFDGRDLGKEMAKTYHELHKQLYR